ncbi:MAG: hypothetical protein P8N61_01275 [Porticoccaceae bacterium]|nr:hypothetical protein [Porticoccaceae bacterium]
MDRFLKYTNFYLLFLFLMPSLLLTWLLLNGYDLPRLSALSSERFWVYLVEIKRSISNGLLSWPGNLESNDFSWLYLERILVRILYVPFDPQSYLLVDALLSYLCFVFGLTYVVKKYYSPTDKYLRFVVLLLVAIQPFYFAKALIYNELIIDLWFGRGLVASAAFVLFMVGAHEMFWKTNLAAASVCAVLLSLIHFYTFLLFLGTIGCYSVYLIYLSVMKDRNFNNVTGQNWVLIALNAAGIIFVLINTYQFKQSLELEFFFDRYIPLSTNYWGVFLRDISYLLFYGSCCLLLLKKVVLTDIERRLIRLVLVTIVAAILIDMSFLVVAPEAINIHFRIYVIEPLLVILFVVILRSRWLFVLNGTISLAFVAGTWMLFNQYVLVGDSLKMDVTQNASAHHFLFHDSLDTCQCTIFDPNTEPFLESRIKGFEPDSAVAIQWENAILHLGRFHKQHD